MAKELNQTSRELDYKKKLEQEAKYWGATDYEILKNGYIPIWIDYQKGKYIPLPDEQLRTGLIRIDPKIQKILVGQYLDFLIKKASEVKGNVIDIGGGSGWLSLELARRGMNVDLFEISKNRIKTAKEYKKSLNENLSINYYCRDLNYITFEKKYVAAVAKDSLHHIMNLDRLFEKIHESLVSGGKLIYFDHIGPDKKNIFYSIAKKIFGRRNIEIPPFEDISGEEMIELTKKYFKIVKMEYTSVFAVAVTVGLKLYRKPKIIKYPLCHLLKFLDDFLIKTGIFRGEFVLVYAIKDD